MGWSTYILHHTIQPVMVQWRDCYGQWNKRLRLDVWKEFQWSMHWLLSTMLSSHFSGLNWCFAQWADDRLSSSYQTGSDSVRCWKASERSTGPPEDTAQPSQPWARVCSWPTSVGCQYARRPSLGSWNYCWNTKSGVLPSTSGQRSRVVPIRRPGSRWHTILVPYISWKAGEWLTSSGGHSRTTYRPVLFNCHQLRIITAVQLFRSSLPFMNPLTTWSLRTVKLWGEEMWCIDSVIFVSIVLCVLFCCLHMLSMYLAILSVIAHLT